MDGDVAADDFPTGPIPVVSEADFSIAGGNMPPPEDSPAGFTFRESDAGAAGDAVDSAIPEEGNVLPLRERNRQRSREDKAKAGPPTLAEWQDFLADVVIRSGTDYYVEWAFREIPDELLTDREVLSLRLTDDDCDKVAKPVAELFNKLEFTRKYGRLVMAGSGTLESVVVLGRWFARVNRIAAKHRPVKGEVIHANVTDRPGEETPAGEGTGATGYFFNPGTG
jgi:hypothetical protein